MVRDEDKQVARRSGCGGLSVDSGDLARVDLPAVAGNAGTEGDLFGTPFTVLADAR